MKRNLLAERDLMMFDPWDALQTGSVISGGFEADKTVCFRKTSANEVTISIYGHIGTSDLTGKPTIEDLEVWLGDGEITNGLQETFLQQIVDDIIEEHS